MTPVMTKGIPNPRFTVSVRTESDVKKLIQWLSGLDFDQMTLKLGDSVYSFQTPQERIYFSFGLEKMLELIKSGDVNVE